MPMTLSKIRTMAGKDDKTKGTRVGNFSDLRALQKKDQKFYDVKYELQIHKAFRKMKLPTARQMVDSFVSHLPLSKPVIEVTPFNDKNPWNGRAIAQQDYFTWLLIWAMQQVENIVQKAAKDLGVRGEAYIKTVWDSDAIGTDAKGKELQGDERDMRLLERMPLRVMCPDPLCCFPHPDHIDCHPEDMLEIYYLQAGQVRRIWKNWKSNSSDSARVRMVEWWSTEEVCFLADNIPVLATEKEGGIVENIYGLVPYTHVYSGYGHPDEDNTPESKAVSLIRHAEEIILQQCRYYAYLDKATAFASTPILLMPGSKSDYDNPPEVPYPGEIIYLGDIQEGQQPKVEWAAQNLPAGIMQAISATEALLGKEQPGVVRGEVPKGVESGYPMALMIGEARLQFGLPLQNLQNLFARAFDQVRVLIRDVAKETIPIWGEDKVIKLKPEDCEGTYRVKVEFDSTSPEARAQKALAGQRLRAGGSISLYTELKEYHNNKNPKKEINRIKAESLMAHPALQRLAAVNAVREIEGEKAALAVQEAMAEGEAGAGRKARSSGVPEGGRPESEVPEDILTSAIGSKRGKALRAEGEVET